MVSSGAMIAFTDIPTGTTSDANSISVTSSHISDSSASVNITEAGVTRNASYLNSLMVGTWYDEFDVPLLLMMVSAFILGLGNWFVMWCFAVSKKLRVPYNVIVVGMSLADGLTTTIVVPMEAYQVGTIFTYAGLNYCRVRVFLKTCCYTSSLMFIFIISVIRLISVVRTFPPVMRFRTVGAIVVLIYVMSALLAILSLDERSSTFNICRATLVQDEENENTIFWAIYFMLSVMMFVCTIVCYVLIFIILKYKASRNTAVTNASASKNEIMTLKVAAIVTLTFAISYLTPYLAIIVTVPFVKQLHYVAVMGAFLFVNSACNPIIYTFSSSVFRRAALSSLQRKCNGPACLWNKVEPASTTAPTQSADQA